MNRLESPGHEERLKRLQQGFRGLSSPRGRKRFSFRAVYWRLRAFSGLIVLGVFAVPALLVVSNDRGAHANLASAEPYYVSCADARAANVAPILRGQPGYRPQLDADGDGVACEAFGW